MKSPAKQHRSQESRKAVVDAAIEIGCDQGYNRTRTREIAQAAYISEGGMFRHFHSKADLFADAFVVAAEGLVEQFERPIADAMSTKDVDLLEQSLRSVLTDRRLRLLIDVISASQFDEELADRLMLVAERVDSRLHAMVEPIAAGLPTTPEEFVQGVRPIFERLLGRLVIGQTSGRDIATDPVIGELAQQVLDVAH